LLEHRHAEGAPGRPELTGVAITARSRQSGGAADPNARSPRARARRTATGRGHGGRDAARILPQALAGVFVSKGARKARSAAHISSKSFSISSSEQTAAVRGSIDSA